MPFDCINGTQSAKPPFVSHILAESEINGFRAPESQLIQLIGMQTLI